MPMKTPSRRTLLALAIGGLLAPPVWAHGPQAHGAPRMASLKRHTAPRAWPRSRSKKRGALPAMPAT